MRHAIFMNILLVLVLALTSGCGSNQSSGKEIMSYVDCSFFASRIEKEEFYQHTKCGTVDNIGLIQLNKDVVQLMDFPAYKSAVKERSAQDQSMFPSHLMCLYVWPAVSGTGRGGIAYFNENGKGRFSPMWDNTCSPFYEGMSVTYVDGNVAYFNEDLKIIKQTNYKFALGFNVCSEIPHKYYRPGTYEHPEWIGGKCGRINSNFEITTPIQYAFEEMPRPLKSNKGN